MTARRPSSRWRALVLRCPRRSKVGCSQPASCMLAGRMVINVWPPHSFTARGALRLAHPTAACDCMHWHARVPLQAWSACLATLRTLARCGLPRHHAAASEAGRLPQPRSQHVPRAWLQLPAAPAAALLHGTALAGHAGVGQGRHQAQLLLARGGPGPVHLQDHTRAGAGQCSRATVHPASAGTLAFMAQRSNPSLKPLLPRCLGQVAALPARDRALSLPPAGWAPDGAAAPAEGARKVGPAAAVRGASACAPCASGCGGAASGCGGGCDVALSMARPPAGAGCVFR